MVWSASISSPLASISVLSGAIHLQPYGVTIPDLHFRCPRNPSLSSLTHPHSNGKQQRGVLGCLEASRHSSHAPASCAVASRRMIAPGRVGRQERRSPAHWAATSRLSRADWSASGMVSVLRLSSCELQFNRALHSHYCINHVLTMNGSWCHCRPLTDTTKHCLTPPTITTFLARCATITHTHSPA